MHKPDIANCNKFKALALNLNQYNRLRGVAKKNSLLQIVTPCREIRGKKKIQPFYKDWISDYKQSTDLGFPMIRHPSAAIKENLGS